MSVIRFLFLLPLLLSITLVEWGSVLLTSFGGAILYILSGIIFLIAALNFVLSIAPGAEIIKMLAIAFVVLIIPHIGDWIMDRIAILNAASVNGILNDSTAVKISGHYS